MLLLFFCFKWKKIKHLLCMWFEEKNYSHAYNFLINLQPNVGRRNLKRCSNFQLPPTSFYMFSISIIIILLINKIFGFLLFLKSSKKLFSNQLFLKDWFQSCMSFYSKIVDFWLRISWIQVWSIFVSFFIYFFDNYLVTAWII